MDLILAVLIFTAVIALFFFFIGRDRQQDTNRLESQARLIQSKLDADKNAEIPIVIQGEISQSELEVLYNTSYEDLKEKFGISSNFCIYIETEDGRIIPVDVDNQKFESVGSGEILVSNNPCGVRP
jgi:type II secretory pathway pseudopilin PulG